jgi:hypothetical protein
MKLRTLLGSLGLAAVACACGARTGLDVWGAGGGAGRDGASGQEATAARSHPDSPADASDAASSSRDAEEDAHDAAQITVAPDCVDTGITYIYVVTQLHQLYRFYPPTATFELIGTVSCSDSAEFYSMAVDRTGIAHVVLMDGTLVRVSTATASCQPTPFVPRQHGFTPTFGMGFVADTNDTGETLFVAGTTSQVSTLGGQIVDVAGQLATINLQSYGLAVVGRLSRDIGDAELTGTAAGTLYAFGVMSSTPGSLHLAQIDEKSATIIQDTFLTFPSISTALSGWAFAYWGGDFYFFTSTDHATSVVSRYTPGASLVVTPVATLDNMVVGAGVSTCAPVD